ncbi:MAG TPA: TMEM175 family protein [Chitinophagaceae bacterium]|nr:TMEM175 family protein [Chitinophagaceae bacterium]
MNKGRLEAFSDGVLAIIITIMVLEIKVPQGADWASLKPLVPVMLSYCLSFVFVAIYWGNHHHLLHTVKTVNAGIIWANINLLFWLSLVPVATGWMGENHFAVNTIIVYAILLLLSGFAYTILQAVVEKTNPPAPALAEALARSRVKGYISVVFYAAAIPFAYVNTVISGILFAMVSVMWLIPDKNIERALKEK